MNTMRFVRFQVFVKVMNFFHSAFMMNNKLKYRSCFHLNLKSTTFITRIKAPDQ